MDEKRTISTGARVLIYVTSVFFDVFVIVLTVTLSLAGLTLSLVGIGLVLPPIAMVLNIYVAIIAFGWFWLIYQVAGVGLKSKLQKFIIKKVLKRLVWTTLVKMIPIIGMLPMYTVGNWLLIRVVDRRDRKQAEKTEEERLEMQEEAGLPAG